MNIAVVTARKGSQDKNVWPVLGKPIIAYPIQAAWLSTHIQDVYVTTDSNRVKAAALDYGCQIIDRPPEFATDDSNHGDCIKHAVELLPDETENVVVLLGNTVMITADLINEALVLLDDRPEIDSVMTVADMADNHPLRVQGLDDKGYLKMYQFVEGEISCNRQDYSPAYIFDGGLWAFRKECVQRTSLTIKPWWWMGEFCVPIIRPFGPARDVHNDEEIAISEWWLRRKDDAYGI